MMKYNTLGSSGLKVSSVAFGTFGNLGYGVGFEVACEILRVCRRNGINFLDTSGYFHSGKADLMLGKALKHIGWDHSSFVIATTVFPLNDWPIGMGHTRKRVIEEVKASVARLQLSHVDIVFISKPDSSTPLEETLQALKFIMAQGLAFYWGTNGWDESDIRNACQIARVLGLSQPIVSKCSYNMVKRAEVEEVPDPSVLQEYGIGLVTSEPLSGGLLTGKYRGGGVNEGSRYAMKPWSAKAEELVNHAAVRACEVLEPIATGFLPALAIAWCLKNSKVKSVIVGATKVEQLEENLEALELKDSLTPDVMELIESALAPILQNQ